MQIWGLFFIASFKPEPDQKARNFVKSYKKGVEKAQSLKSESGITRARRASNLGDEKKMDDEEQPPWEVAHSSTRRLDQVCFCVNGRVYVSHAWNAAKGGTLTPISPVGSDQPAYYSWALLSVAVALLLGSMCVSVFRPPIV